MEYDEQVSARLDMSLDEIIGQEQQDGSSHLKKRKAKSGPPGSASLPPPTTHAPLYRAPPALQAEYADRSTAAFVPAAGAANSVTSRPTPAGRHAPVLVRGPPGRLPPPPPYAVARPPFPVPLSHSRTDTRWPRPRPLGGGYLVAPNGVRPPPPPIGGAPGGPPRPFPLPPRPSGPGELEYTQIRPVVGPYTEPHAVPPGSSVPMWKRSRHGDEVEGQNGHHSPHDPMGYSVGIPTFGSMRSPQLLSDPSGPVPKPVPYGYGPRCPPSTEYYEPTYRRDAAGEHGHGYGASPEGLVPPPVRRGHSDDAEIVWNRQTAPDPASATPGMRGLPIREADAPAGGSAGACLAQRKEFNVIVSNVPKDLPAVEIQEAFSCMGTVLRTDIMLNSKGEHTGRVCIAFASAEAARTAVGQQAAKLSIDDAIRVLFAHAAQFDKGDLNGNTIRVFAE